MDFIPDSALLTFSSATLEYDFTFEFPPIQVHELDHETELPWSELNVVHCCPDVAVAAPQLL
jgi:hypothetical protein